MEFIIEAHAGLHVMMEGIIEATQLASSFSDSNNCSCESKTCCFIVQ